jgi:hypothetical protein
MDVNVSNLIVKRKLKWKEKTPPKKMKGPKNSNSISKKPTTQQIMRCVR